MAHKAAAANDEEGERSKLLSTEKPPQSVSKRKRSKTVPTSPSPSDNAVTPDQLSQIQSDAGQQKVKRRQMELKATVQKARFE